MDGVEGRGSSRTCSVSECQGSASLWSASSGRMAVKLRASSKLVTVRGGHCCGLQALFDASRRAEDAQGSAAPASIIPRLIRLRAPVRRLAGAGAVGPRAAVLVAGGGGAGQHVAVRGGPGGPPGRSSAPRLGPRRREARRGWRRRRHRAEAVGPCKACPEPHSHLNAVDCGAPLQSGVCAERLIGRP